MNMLLATKTYLPSKPGNLVTRPRLIALLDAGLLAHSRLAIISALAGSGKSTLLVDWAGTLQGPVAWLSLDAEDNDLYRFWAYVLHAIQSRFPQACESLLKDLSSAPPPAMADFLPALINTLAQLISLERPYSFVIVLDDYHIIENQSIHESLTFFIDHLPPNVQLIIATRTDPTLPLHRWRSHSQLVELRSADLSFTMDEAEKFLNEVMGLHLRSEEVYQLGKRTEGWAVGLQLAGLSLRGREDAAAFIDRFSGSHHFVLEYLTNEVLSQQPPEVQEFLLQTSILEKMCSELCDAVIIESREQRIESCNDSRLSILDSRTILDYLDRSNLFLIPLDDERQWYRYHHLFAELLRMRLAQQGEDRLHRLHQQAAEWYAIHGAIDEAIAHALAARNTAFAADLVVRNWLRAGFEGRVRTALHWIELLPKEIVIAHPLLSAANAYLLYLGGLKDSAEEHIQHVYKALAAWEAQGYVPQDGYDYSALPAEMAVLRANLATRKGEFQKGMEAAQEALRVAPKKAQVQGIAWNALSHAYRELGDIAEAIPSYQQAIRWNQTSGNIIAVALAARYLSRLFQIQGDLHQAEESLYSVLEQADQAHQAHLPAYGLLYLALGEISYERNDMKKARQWLDKGLEQGKPGGSLDLLLSAGILEARLRRASGDLTGATAVLEKTFRSIHRMDEPVTEREAGAWQSRYQAEAGHLQEAAQWIERLPPPTDSRLGLTHGIGLFSQVRVLLAMGQIHEAQDLAARLEKTADVMNCLAWESEALLLQAEVDWLLSDPDPALRKLSRALAIAEPRGFTRLFLDEGRLVAAMLKGLSTQSRDGNRERAAHLLDLFPVTDKEKKSLVSPACTVHVPLSDRETEVLLLMAAGFSNPVIAERLVVSTATVKTHVRHIYDKLDVQNRAEAVAQAKEKGLI